MLNKHVPKVTVNYCKEGIAIGDFTIDDFIEDILNSIRCSLLVSTENIIHVLRAYHKEGNIKLTVFFQDEEIPIDKNGMFKYYPEGFLDTNNKWLMKLLK